MRARARRGRSACGPAAIPGGRLIEFNYKLNLGSFNDAIWSLDVKRSSAVSVSHANACRRCHNEVKLPSHASN